MATPFPSPHFAPETIEASPANALPGIVVLSKFVIANGMTAAVKEAFRARPHQVDQTAGFVRMEVLSPTDRPEEIWLFTWWSDRESYRRWHHSHAYRDSHRGIPKGLKLARGETSIREFERVSG